MGAEKWGCYKWAGAAGRLSAAGAAAADGQVHLSRGHRRSRWLTTAAPWSGSWADLAINPRYHYPLSIKLVYMTRSPRFASYKELLTWPAGRIQLDWSTGERGTKTEYLLSPIHQSDTSIVLV